MLEAYFYIVDLQFPWDICENNFPVLFLNHYPVFSKNCLTSPSGETDSSGYTPLPEFSAAFGPLALRVLRSALQHAVGMEDCGHPLCQRPGGAKQCLIR